MSDSRPDPDALLAKIHREGTAGTAGRLLIFLGMCPGVGKTYAMLQAARKYQAEGTDVLVGLVETHGRAETQTLLDGLPLLPRKSIPHSTHTLEEFDLDAALLRRPELLLLDELAHTNAPGSRHLKRWQDVLELLEAGIDVCTTLNVQHIESQVDTVRQITGITIQETVPDLILDRAHEIQLVDLSVEKLIDRLHEGRIYPGERAQAAADGFFKESNLTALRELALRFTAERVDRDLEDIRRAKRVSSPWKTNARLLVGVGPTPYSESLIRWTRRAAGRLGCPWIAVWVEGNTPLSPASQELLGKGLALVRRLGGEVVHITDEDVARGLLRVASDRNVSQIVVGKTARRHFWKPSLTDRIIQGSGDIDVFVVRPLIGRPSKLADTRETSRPHPFPDYALVLLLTTFLTALCWSLSRWTGYTLPAFIFLLGIVLTAFRVRRSAILLMAALSALTWDYFFIPPRFTFHISSPEDMAMLGMFFVVALAMGHLTSRLRLREAAERQRQTETDALLRVTQSAALGPDLHRGLSEALRTINLVLHAETVLIVRKLDHSLSSEVHPSSTVTPSDREYGVAAWAYANKQAAGRFTDTLPSSSMTWFPLQTATSVMGTLGVLLPPETSGLDFGRRQTLEAFALQLALVLEKDHFIQAVTHAELLEKSEHLRRTLLDSVSHELKTPLAVIRASIEGLSPTQDPYLREIDTASKRLQRLVDSLLQMTRLESQIIEPNLEWCDAQEILDSALTLVGDSLQSHPVRLHLAPDLPLLQTDQTLLSQALANILHNASIYTPAHTPIEVQIHHHNGTFHFTLTDHGPGLPPGEESKVFGKFYRSPGSPAGGTGLGLSIAMGFIRALGGSLSAHNSPQGGAVFEVTLQAPTLPVDSTQIPGLAEPSELHQPRLA